MWRRRSMVRMTTTKTWCPRLSRGTKQMLRKQRHVIQHSSRRCRWSFVCRIDLVAIVSSSIEPSTPDQTCTNSTRSSQKLDQNGPALHVPHRPPFQLLRLLLLLPLLPPLPIPRFILSRKQLDRATIRNRARTGEDRRWVVGTTAIITTSCKVV